MERLTFVDEDGQVLFDNPAGFSEDVGFTIRELAENGEWGTLDNIAQRLANCEQRIKHYEDLEEQGQILIVPKIKKNKTLYWIWENEIMPVLFKRITSCVVDDMGNPHVMCEMTTKKDRTFIQTYRRKPVEHTFKAGDKRYFYSEDIGKTVFLTKEEAKTALNGGHDE